MPLRSFGLWKCKKIGGEVCGKGGEGRKRNKAVKSALVAAADTPLQLQVDRRSKSCSKKDLGPKNVWHLAMEENADYTWTASGCGAAEGSFTEFGLTLTWDGLLT